MPVTFTEKDHRYTSHTGEAYISVTTLLHKFEPPFEADYWSAYKAIKAVLERKGEWNDYKKNVGGWENVVAATRLNKSFPYRKEVVEEKRKILESWEDNKNDALTKGSAYHKMKEAAVKAKIVYTPELVEVPVLQGIDVLAGNVPDGLYPELVLYNDDWGIAGQADWVMVRGKRVDIKDYKTSKEIKKEGFMEARLLPPLGHLPAANFWVYSLQLSLYALMMEEKGFEIGRLFIEHVDKNTQAPLGMYPTEYMRNEAKAIVKYYCESKAKHRT
jgi:hypothetical protein